MEGVIKDEIKTYCFCHGLISPYTNFWNNRTTEFLEPSKISQDVQNEKDPHPLDFSEIPFPNFFCQNFVSCNRIGTQFIMSQRVSNKLCDKRITSEISELMFNNLSR